MTGSQTPLGVAMTILVAALAIGVPLIPILERALQRYVARVLNRPVNDNEPQEVDRV